MLMWQDLWAALALVLVIEGIMPFLNPRGLRRTMKLMNEMSDSALRFVGLSCMVVGVILLALIR